MLRTRDQRPGRHATNERRTSPPRILLTGRPGCGKTTVILRTLELLDRATAGFYTEEVRQRGARIGFDLVTLDGRRVPFARAGASGPRVGRYGVDVTTFENVGVSALERGLDRTDTLLVIDELGKMEFMSDAFVSLLPLIFDAPNAILATVLQGRHPVADPLRTQPGVEVIEVSSSNRDVLPLQLADRLSL
jgi:nucleoside-triphosphatase